MVSRKGKKFSFLILTLRTFYSELVGKLTEGLIFLLLLLFSFYLFVVWIALIVDRWVMAVQRRNSYLGAVVFLVLFKYGGRRVGPRFHNLVSDVYQRNKESGKIQDSLA